MLVPDGFLAAYIFTEHADAGNMRTHKAAYFGNENITDITMASGGFAGHEIPVTKNVFFEYLDGRLVINPLFDKMLSYLDSQRDKGDLFLTTVKDLLNYWLLLENVRFEYNINGTIDMFNDNNQEIKGLSIAISSSSGRILLDGNEPMSRTINGDLIFWLDIPANSRRTISFADHI
jgi:hypothetical protein